MTTGLIFTCIVILVTGALLAWYVSIDDFDGMWVSIGVMEGDHLVPFAGGALSYTLSFDEGNVVYFIGDEQLPVTRSGRRLQVELAAQICIDYKIEIQESHLVMTDPHGMRMVFEKVEEDDER